MFCPVFMAPFHLFTIFSKRLDPGSSHPTKPLRALGGRQAGMTRYIVGSLTTLLPMVFSNLYPADPVDPVIRVLLSISPFHDLFVAPIYMEGGLICKTWLACGLPAVILNPVRDDLRMMALKPVAAKAGGMKHYAECIGLYMCLSRNWCRLFLDWVLVSDVGFTQINADN